MPSRQEPLQFYTTMNPDASLKSGNEEQWKKTRSSEKLWNSSAASAPGKLHFYSSMNDSAPKGVGRQYSAFDSGTSTRPSSSGNHTAKQQPSTSSRPPYTVQCAVRAASDQKSQPAANAHIARIAHKQEQVSQEFGGGIAWEYAHDPKGHLTQARRNGIVVEEYHYSTKGARVQDMRNFSGMREYRNFAYDADGRLASALLPGQHGAP